MNERQYKLCPRCETESLHPTMVMNALSRKDNKTYICSKCGVKESLEEYEIYKLTEKRNDIVRRWEKDTEPFNQARMKGEKVDWEKYDNLTDEMQRETAKIDHELFKLGAIY